MTELTLFDVPPSCDVPECSSPATVYTKGNVDHGHLLIANDTDDWIFEWTGRTVRCYTPGGLHAMEMGADQMRTLGEYCLKMAERIRKPADDCLG